MDAVDWKVRLVVITAVITVFAPWYIFFRIGRMVERRELTSALVRSIEETYYMGYADGKGNVYKAIREVCK